MPGLPRLTVPLTDGELNLRPFDLDDVTAVTEACQDPDISRWTATIPFPYPEEDARSWISTHGDLWSTGQAAQFAITTPTDALLGNLGIQPIDWGDRSAVVGYWVAAWARRRGVATGRFGWRSRGPSEMPAWWRSTYRPRSATWLRSASPRRRGSR